MGEKVETVTDFIFLGFKITADNGYNHEMKSHLLLGRKVMTTLESILKSRYVTLLTKAHIVKAMVFPVVMYRCWSWTIMKAECWRIDVFELWYWRRLSRILWTARRSNQSIIKKINPEYSLKDWSWRWNSNILATWWEEPTHWKRPWCWEKLRGRRRREQQIMSWLDGITNSMEMSLSKLQDIVKDSEAWCPAIHWLSKSQTRLSDWTKTLKVIFYYDNPYCSNTTCNMWLDYHKYVEA